MNDEFGLEISDECIQHLKDIAKFCEARRKIIAEDQTKKIRNKKRSFKKSTNKKDGDGHLYANDIKKKQDS